MTREQFVQELREHVIYWQAYWPMSIAMLEEGQKGSPMSDQRLLFYYSRCALCGEVLFTDEQLTDALVYRDTAEEVLDELYRANQHRHT